MATVLATRPWCASVTRLGSRWSSTNAVSSRAFEAGAPYQNLDARVNHPERTFERLSTKSLLRSVILGQIFKSPYLFKPGLYLLQKIADSKSSFLDADKNPLIRAIVLPLIYRQFCAGRNVTEIKQTVADIKKMGYSGVILCFSGEVMARKDLAGNHTDIGEVSAADNTRKQIETWRDGHLATLNAVSEGDFIGVKYTGAGPSISHALKSNLPPPPDMLAALHTICTHARAQNKQIWFDAEQQVYHPAIDTWTIDLMRQYNRNTNGHALVLTTIQAYLKSARTATEEYLRLAGEEGWNLGIKLVRGAYIASDVRDRIHDTKADTDACYDSIVHDVLSKSWPGIEKSSFPTVQLFLAGHNTTSVRKAATLVQSLAHDNQISERVCYGQLQGMADDIGCELLALGDQAQAAEGSEEEKQRNLLGAPRAYKCLTWGSVKECLHYLVRRAIENQGAAERMNAGLAEMRRELRMRFLRF